MLPLDETTIDEGVGLLTKLYYIPIRDIQDIN